MAVEIRRLQSPDRAVQALQDDAQTLSDGIGLLAQGNIITCDSVSSTPKEFNHGLGRTPIGWIQLDIKHAFNFVYRTTWDDLTITLRTDGSATETDFKVLVF